MDQVIKYKHEIIGSNFRMTNIQAAIGLAQIQRVNEIVDYRNKCISIYKKFLKKSFFNFIPRKVEDSIPSPWFLILRLNKYDKNIHTRIEENLKNNHIEFRNLFYPLNNQKAFSKYKLIHSKRNQENLSRNGLMLPLHHKLDESIIKRICSYINVL